MDLSELFYYLPLSITGRDRDFPILYSVQIVLSPS